jgi:glyoxylase-like metal-dependent hydrolase (beta-lactamase superfamily II)
MNKGSLIENHNGIYIIRQQMPYPLRENNAYLTETDDGWAVIDLGIDIQETRELWEEALIIAGINFSSIKKIIVTHCHPDHLGAAGWMQRMTEAPVYISKRDRDIASIYIFLKGDIYTLYEKAIREAVVRADYGEEKTWRLVN